VKFTACEFPERLPLEPPMLVGLYFVEPALIGV
jgi:hypothetical protein